MNKIKTIFIAFFLCCIITTTGCITHSSSPSILSEHEQIEDEHSDLFTDEKANFFSTIDELEAAIESNELGCNKGNELTGYYKPNCIPSNSRLDYIQVKDFYVALFYQIDHSDAYYMIEWYRTLAEGQLVSGVLKYFSQDNISVLGKYYIVSSNENSSVKDVFWEQDGAVFHAVVPIIYNLADISKYCDVSYNMVSKGGEQK